MKNAASLLIFLSALTAFAAGEIKTVVITISTFSLEVPDHHFLRIYNFTQDVGGSTRGVVIAAAATPTATQATVVFEAIPRNDGMTSSPTPTPTPTPITLESVATSTPTPTPNATPSITPTPSPTP